MDITRLLPEDTPMMDAFWELYTDVFEHDQPGSPPAQRKSAEVDIANLRSDMRQEYHLAHVNQQLAGYVRLLFPLLDNKHFMYVNGCVRPEHRRRGVGSELLELALRRGRSCGRVTIGAHTSEPLPGGPYRSTSGRDFLRAKGFDLAHSMRDFSVDLENIKEKIEEDLVDEFLPHAWEYELLSWSGPTPEEHLPAVTALANRFVSEVPLGDLALEDKNIDVERQRAAESLDAVRGRTNVSAYARHPASGELVAHSVISVDDESPEFAHQQVTLVHPEHRGHRLGTLVKIESHRLLRREFPGVRTLFTSVAEVNTHMLAINERLGFVEVDRQLDFQRTI
ncbi:GNAT family N-acetyltransferase [Stackebrandtia nassauensis]|uniref:GCN5-related N-acetyltransferase n=1 Tax=Stackebrandtia nassauensis (strain DSM 44728 / CIP 108903 / NRRL B-16338 / NBRC 102104 / LLR-40K-21) TaxID=446470 RepID=D3Q1F5_STANL|nr:GNAT family N-acetyltransferase [Stackebrandtia nassauensis]ADD45735.1 GCN5-related N-acetyltransferase [Stackebrandtia nassauensis DSM 44728]